MTRTTRTTSTGTAVEAGERHDPDHVRPAQAAQAIFAGRVLVVVAVAAGAAALWLLRDIVLLTFGAVLVALGLDMLAGRITRYTGLSRTPAVLVSLAFIIAVIGGMLTLFGAQMAGELRNVFTQLPDALDRFMTRDELEAMLKQVQSTTAGSLAAGVLAWGGALLGAVAGLFLVVAAGVHLALQPDLYRRGFIALVPRQNEAAAVETLDACGTALKFWFGGQLAAMVLVGAMASLGLWLLGVPAFLGLGLIAGLTEFVPYLGPIAGAAPAVLLATSNGVTQVGAVILLFVVIQQLENHVILPLIMGHMVDVPPVIGIFGTIGCGILLGPLGLLLGYPLVIVSLVIVRRLYVEGYLGRSLETGAD